ncbi:MAG: PilZ domain-containing protein [Candidatus Lambdaproteobacteria bacterium]|nr:PilZ domain-containing protein [Candidatus Lambdaproteobacteria bacterium]
MHAPPILAVATELDLKYLQFQQSESAGLNQVVMFSVLGVVLLILGILFLLYLKRRLQASEYNKQREEARFRLFLTELGLNERDRELLETFSQSVDPVRNIPLIEVRKAFEEAVAAFRESFPEHAALRKAAYLRQKLGYGFNNRRNPFDDTRMLSAGLRVQCRLPVKREITFLTSVVGVTERHMFIRPPTVKGKPVDLRRFHALTFRIAREDDAEYQFTAQVVGQSQQAVAVEHTGEIQRLLFRNAARLQVHIDTQFFIVRHEVAAARSHSHFKADESQYALHGHVEDLSIGGALLIVPQGEQDPQEGDMVLFRLVEAQIRDDLVGTVVGTQQRADGTLQMHGEFVGMKELNRLKLSRFLQQLQSRPAPQAPPAGADQGTATTAS